MKHSTPALVALLSLAAAPAAADAPSAVATFESLSLYWAPDAAGAGRVVQPRFREAGTAEWREGYPMPHAPIPRTDAERAPYRGSLVLLRPGTEYEVELSLRDASGEELERAELVASTWPEAFPEDPDVIRIEDRTSPLVIDRSGTPGAYRVFDGRKGDGTRAKIDVGRGNDSPRAAVRIDASYVILRNVEVIGGRHGVQIFGGENIVIEDSEITGWGHEQHVFGQSFGFNHNAAIKSTETSIRRLIVQRNVIHHPFTDSNHWGECALRLSDGEPCARVPSRESHPGGAQAIDLINTQGNHVFRYNLVFSDQDHYFNDIFGGSYGWSDDGYPGHDSDIYGNYLANCWDDALELEGGTRNVRVWGNFVEETYQVLANDPIRVGPLYFFRNMMRRSDRYPDRSEAGLAMKGGGERDIGGFPAYVFYFHNTLINMDEDGYGGLGGGRPLQRVVSRNNILHVRGRHSASISTNEASRDIDVDYDLFNKAVPSGSERHGVRGTPTYASPDFDRTTWSYDFQLAAGTAGHDQGVRLPNFNDEFEGAGPDIGAHERGLPRFRVGPEGGLPRCMTEGEHCGDGVDDDCDGRIDEDCPSSGPAMAVVHSASEPRVDGSFDDLFPSGATVRLDDERSATVHAAWSATSLVLGFTVRDSDIRALVEPGGEGAIWLDDAVQVFIDPERDGGSALTGGDLQVIVNARNARYLSRDTRLETAVVPSGSLGDSETDEGYRVEIAVPWDSLGYAPVPEGTLGLHLALSFRDAPDDGTPRGAVIGTIDWAGNGENYLTPSSWGSLKLLPPGGAPPRSEPDAGVSGGDASSLPQIDGGMTPSGGGGCSVGRVPSTSGSGGPMGLLILVALLGIARHSRTRSFGGVVALALLLGCGDPGSSDDPTPPDGATGWDASGESGRDAAGPVGRPDGALPAEACRHLDLVISIDPSGSMSEEREALGSEVFPRLADALAREVGGGLESFRVATIDACPQPANFHTRGDGGECLFESGQAWIESGASDLSGEFQCVGDLFLDDVECSGRNDDEQPASAAATALSAPWTDGPNAGFLRDDALLVVMAITDEDETPVPDASVREMYERLVSAKGDVRRVVFIGIGGADECSGVYGRADRADDLRSLTALFEENERGVFWDLCSGALENGLREALDVIQRACRDLPTLI